MITHRIGLERVAAILDEDPSGGAVKVLVAPNGHPDREGAAARPGDL